MNRPHTSNNRAVLRTASTVKTSRSRSGPVTIAGRQAASLPLHEINVSDRPVTAAGGMSMGRTQIESGNDRINERQVRDASYYLALLKNKETEIITETERLEHDIAVMKQESNSIGKSKDESEKLLVEIGDLEGNLSLLNLAIDKYRAGEDPDDMIQFQQQLKKKNDLKANEVDIVFLGRQKAQNKILNIERSINDANHTVVNYLKNVGQAYLEQYNDLIKEQENILLKKKKFEDKNGAIKTNIYSIQNELKRKIGNDITQEFKEYEKRIKDLKRSIKEIDEDINIFQMDSKEAHVYLLKKVKSAKQNTLNLDATIKEKDMEKLELMKEKSILQSEVDNNRIVFFEDDGAIPLGLDAMILKDKDMTNSLEMAKTSFNKIKIDHDQTKSTISLLLEHLSESIVASKIEAPTIAQMEILQNDVSFKTKQLQNSEQTMVMLEEQKKKRGDELEKVQGLEERIKTEQGHLENKMKMMTTEIEEKFQNNDELQARAEATKDYLLQMKERYTKRRDFIAGRVKVASQSHEELNERLKKSEIWNSLQLIEGKARQQGQSLFTLREFVNAKGAEVGYDNIKKKCLQMANSLNKATIERTQ